MQAIILTAGNGIRFMPLSSTRPKPLFSIFNQSILEHNLNQIVGIVDEVFFVVNYKSEMIKDIFGKEYKGIKINYVFQEKIEGTGSAAELCKANLRDRFLILYGDDFYFKEDIEKLVKKFPSVLVQEHKNPSSFGVIVTDGELVKEIMEKPENPVSNLVNTGLYYLPKDIFVQKIEKSPRGEYEFTDYLKKLINRENVYFVISENWFPSSYPWDIFNAFEKLFIEAKERESSKNYNMESNVTLKGDVIIGENALIKSGAYIEGPVYIGSNCIIGPNCYIRSYSALESGVKIGQAVEINRSIIGKNSKIQHLSYIGDSIIGENCNIGAGTITANLRHDGENVKTKIKDKMVDTGRRKFGAIIGDNTKIGVNTIIYPGRKIAANKSTMPGEKVEKDIE
ncbi:MAG: sugar phosphate nucleotidyltransferase [Candidatus Pacebacteria bacterium]|nr:sugar phosphate nucleotidyltransferase [Candidatus Paceibacterota bacterium]